MPPSSSRSPNRQPIQHGPRVDISIVDVTAVDEEAYFINAVVVDPKMVAAGGYEFSVFGMTDGTYDRGGSLVEVPEYRVHLKIDSNPDRYGFPEGVIGGGRFHREYAEVGLSLDHDYVRDILFELRRDPRREIRVAGPATSDTSFHVDLFMLSPPR